MEVKSYNEQDGKITVELVDNDETLRFGRLSDDTKWWLLNYKKKGSFNILAGPYGITYMSKNFLRTIRHVKGVAKEDYVEVSHEEKYDCYYINDINDISVKEYLQNKKINYHSKKYNQLEVDLVRSSKAILDYVDYSERYIPVLDEIVKKRDTSNTKSQELVKSLGQNKQRG